MTDPIKEDITNSAKSLKKSSTSKTSTTFTSNNSQNLDFTINTSHQIPANTTLRNLPSKNFHNKLNSSLSRDSIRYKDPDFPFCKLAIDITVTSKEITGCFIEELKKNGFFIRKADTDDDFYAEKKHFDLIRSFLNCFKHSEDNSNQTAVSLIVFISNNNKFERIVELAGLSGKKDVISAIIESIVYKLKALKKKIRFIRTNNLSLNRKPEKASSSDRLNYST